MSELAWNLIKQQRFEEAFEKATKDGEIHNAIIALLNLKRYSEAYDLAVSNSKLNSGNVDVDFIYAGIANLLLGNKDKAILILKQGQNALYKDAAGGVDVLLLLYHIGVITKDTELEKEVLKLLKKKAKNKTITNFPGPIVQFILGEINENQLFDYAQYIPNLKERYFCKVHFYIGILLLKDGKVDEFIDNIKDSRKNTNYFEAEYYCSEGILNSEGIYKNLM